MNMPENASESLTHNHRRNGEDLRQFHMQMHKLLTSESLTDVEVIVKGSQFRAHRVVLAAASPMFARILLARSNRKALSVRVEGSPGAFKALLGLIYSGEMRFDEEDVKDILLMAKTLQIDLGDLLATATQWERRKYAALCRKCGLKNREAERFEELDLLEEFEVEDFESGSNDPSEDSTQSDSNESSSSDESDDSDLEVLSGRFDDHDYAGQGHNETPRRVMDGRAQRMDKLESIRHLVSPAISVERASKSGQQRLPSTFGRSKPLSTTMELRGKVSCTSNSEISNATKDRPVQISPSITIKRNPKPGQSGIEKPSTRMRLRNREICNNDGDEKVEETMVISVATAKKTTKKSETELRASESAASNTALSEKRNESDDGGKDVNIWDEDSDEDFVDLGMEDVIMFEGIDELESSSPILTTSNNKYHEGQSTSKGKVSKGSLLKTSQAVKSTETNETELRESESAISVMTLSKERNESQTDGKDDETELRVSELAMSATPLRKERNKSQTDGKDVNIDDQDNSEKDCIDLETENIIMTEESDESESPTSPCDKKRNDAKSTKTNATELRVSESALSVTPLSKKRKRSFPREGTRHMVSLLKIHRTEAEIPKAITIPSLTGQKTGEKYSSVKIPIPFGPVGSDDTGRVRFGRVPLSSVTLRMPSPPPPPDNRKGKPEKPQKEPRKEKKKLSLTCEICGKSYKNRLNALRHSRTHFKSIMCTLCGKTFAEKIQLVRHMAHKHRAQMDGSPLVPGESVVMWTPKTYPKERCICFICGEKCGTQAKYHEHRRLMHTAEKAYVCDLCGKSFHYPETLKAHTTTVHVKPRKPVKETCVCPLCGEKCGNQGKYFEHMRTVHAGEKPCVCEICGKGFVDPRSVKQHASLLHSTPEEKATRLRLKMEARARARLAEANGLSYRGRPRKKSL